MKKTNKTQSAPKTVSADTKSENLALNINVNSFEELRKQVGAHEEATPGEVFEHLVTSKDICTRPILREMFSLSKHELHCIIYEGPSRYRRGIHDNETALWILPRSHIYDYEKMELTPIPYSPAQEKLRDILFKRLNLRLFSTMADIVEDRYGYSILYEIYDDIEEKYRISEDEILDALHTYQSEHLS